MISSKANTFRKNIGHELQCLGITPAAVYRRYFETSTLSFNEFLDLINGTGTRRGLSKSKIALLASFANMPDDEVAAVFEKAWRNSGPVVTLEDSDLCDKEPLVLPRVASSPEEAMICAEEAENRIYEIIGTLPAEFGSVFVDWVEELTVEEIAASRDLPVEDVQRILKTVVFSALDHLGCH